MKIFKKIKMIHIKSAFASLSGYSRTVLHIGLPTVLFYFVAFLYELMSSDMPSYILAHTHFSALEHIIMSVTLIIIGAIFIDILDRDRKRTQK